ncbi:MAG: SDR family oxidoreductase [Pseudomonadota bacterium]
MKVLVAGATGGTGRHLIDQLLRLNHEPIALLRPSSADAELPGNCQSRIGDLTDLPDKIVHGVDGVVFAAGAGSDTGKDATDAVDRDGAIALIETAKGAGVERFVMLSSKGADAPNDAPQEMRRYLQAKAAADTHLRNSGLDYAIVRPISLSDEIGDGAVVIARHVDPQGEIPRTDVAAILSHALTHERARNETFEAGPGASAIVRALDLLS